MVQVVGFQVKAKGRAVLPIGVRKAANVSEGDRMMAHAEGPGRIVLETVEAIQARVWAAAPVFRGLNTVTDIREMREEDNKISDANYLRRSREVSPESEETVGTNLLVLLGRK